jgi:hypothetical protein
MADLDMAAGAWTWVTVLGTVMEANCVVAGAADMLATPRTIKQAAVAAPIIGSRVDCFSCP